MQILPYPDTTGWDEHLVNIGQLNIVIKCKPNSAASRLWNKMSPSKRIAEIKDFLEDQFPDIPVVNLTDENLKPILADINGIAMTTVFELASMQNKNPQEEQKKEESKWKRLFQKK